MSLSSRYLAPTWGTDFWGFVDAVLHDSAAILDLGGGRNPTIAPERRPAGACYVGLDIAADELRLAGPGAYDETYVTDVEAVVRELIGRFDVIVSWQVLEHVPCMPRAAQALHAYLRPGGWLVSMLSGRNAVYAFVNRSLSPAVGARLVARLRRRPLDTVFRAYYDHCTESGLRQAFAPFAELHINAHWRGADYFERSHMLQRLYLRYEDWAARHDFRELATHYVLAARRDPRLSTGMARMGGVPGSG